MQAVFDLFRSVWDRIVLFVRRLLKRDDTMVAYYGCPNSNKARKLQTGKRIYR